MKNIFNFNNKNADISTDKIIIFVIALLVLATVLMFIFQPGISEWIKNLPSYQTEGDKEIDVTKLSAGNNILGCIPFATLVGKSGGSEDIRKISIPSSSGNIILKDFSVETDKNYNILFDPSGLGNSISSIGILKNGVYEVNKEILNNYYSSDKYSNLRNSFISQQVDGEKILMLLDGSKIVGTNLCYSSEKISTLDKELENKITRMILSDKKSNTLSLVFSSFFNTQDIIEIYYDFSLDTFGKNRGVIIKLKPNGNEIPQVPGVFCGGLLDNVKFTKCLAATDKTDVNNLNKFNFDLVSLSTILDSNSASQVPSEIFSFLKDKKATILGYKGTISNAAVSNLLYGMNAEDFDKKLNNLNTNLMNKLPLQGQYTGV